ncbi:hypothetical protein ACFL1B_05730 [Nanoarchaeota archaeon]
MPKKKWTDKPKAPRIDYKKKVAALEEELKRKDDIIEKIKTERDLLFNTALKNSEKKVDTKLKLSSKK